MFRSYVISDKLREEELDISFTPLEPGVNDDVVFTARIKNYTHVSTNSTVIMLHYIAGGSSGHAFLSGLC